MTSYIGARFPTNHLSHCHCGMYLFHGHSSGLINVSTIRLLVCPLYILQTVKGCLLSGHFELVKFSVCRLYIADCPGGACMLPGHSLWAVCSSPLTSSFSMDSPLATTRAWTGLCLF